MTISDTYNAWMWRFYNHKDYTGAREEFQSFEDYVNSLTTAELLLTLSYEEEVEETNK